MSHYGINYKSYCNESKSMLLANFAKCFACLVTISVFEIGHVPPFFLTHSINMFL